MSESEKDRVAEKHADPAPPVEVPDAVRERVRVQASPVRCPFCHDDVRVAEQRWVACAGCLARHHTGCWSDAGRCSACGDAASLAGGGASRVRTIAAVTLATVVVLLVLAGIALVMLSIEGLREDVRAQRAAPPEPQPPLPPIVIAPPPPPPYLGETPEVAVLRLAAHGGDASAAHDLAVALQEGKRVLPDPAEALRWFERAADRGDARAMRVVASLKTDPAQRIFWLRRSLEVDFDPKTAEKLITALDEDVEALVWLERLSDRTADPALMMQAHHLHMRHRISDQVGWVERAVGALRDRVERGDMNAARTLVRLLEAGDYRFEGAVPPRTSYVMEARPEEALALLEGLAARGQVWAMGHLERAYRNGDLGLERDPRRQREWLLKQVELRDPSAIHRYTDLLAASDEHPEAVDLLRRELAREGLAHNDRLFFRRLLGHLVEKRADLRQPGDP